MTPRKTAASQNGNGRKPVHQGRVTSPPPVEATIDLPVTVDGPEAGVEGPEAAPSPGDIRYRPGNVEARLKARIGELVFENEMLRDALEVAQEEAAEVRVLREMIDTLAAKVAEAGIV